jgi:hypothetical protein
MLLLFIVDFYFHPFGISAITTNDPTHIRLDAMNEVMCTQFRCNPQSTVTIALLSTIRQHIE